MIPKPKGAVVIPEETDGTDSCQDSGHYDDTAWYGDDVGEGAEGEHDGWSSIRRRSAIFKKEDGLVRPPDATEDEITDEHEQSGIRFAQTGAFPLDRR